jgi:hypothetical protein
MAFKIQWLHPFNFILKDTNQDLKLYGFSLDLTTEIYYYKYDWGYGFNFRILGFGFEITKVGI